MKLPAVELILGLAGIATAMGDTAQALRLAAAGAIQLSLLAPDGAEYVEYQDVIEARESPLRPRNVGAGLGRGCGNDPRRGRGLRTLLRLTLGYDSAAQTSNGFLSVVLTSVRTPSVGDRQDRVPGVDQRRRPPRVEPSVVEHHD